MKGVKPVSGTSKSIAETYRTLWLTGETPNKILPCPTLLLTAGIAWTSLVAHRVHIACLAAETLARWFEGVYLKVKTFAISQPYSNSNPQGLHCTDYQMASGTMPCGAGKSDIEVYIVICLFT